MLQVGGRALPAAEFFPERLVCLMPRVARHALEWPITAARPSGGQCAECHWFEGRAEFGGAHLARRSLGHRAHQDQRIDIAGLTLVGGHARRCVALEVLHRAVVLACGQGHIGCGDIILQVDKHLCRLAPRGCQGCSGRAVVLSHPPEATDLRRQCLTSAHRIRVLQRMLCIKDTGASAHRSNAV